MNNQSGLSGGYKSLALHQITERQVIVIMTNDGAY